MRQDKPWGYYEVLAEGPNYKIKLICVFPGGSLSLQRHCLRSEHWYIVDGEALVTCNDSIIELQIGKAVDIPQAAVHRIRNTGKKDLVFVEIQTGTYLGEDDIERLEDDYGRL